MPCYHFTFHGYGTWMPDEDDGYVLRGKGHQPQDTVKAAQYRWRMKQAKLSSTTQSSKLSSMKSMSPQGTSYSEFTSSRRNPHTFMSS